MVPAISISTHYPVTVIFFRELHLNNYNTVNAGLFFWINVQTKGRRQWHATPVSCLENPMDGGAWWAAVHGVAKSRTRLSG